MQLDGDLDNSVLDTTIVDVPYIPRSEGPANQEAQNDLQARVLANQEGQGSRDKETRTLNTELEGEQNHLLTLALILLLTTTLANGQNSPIEEDNRPPG